MSFLEVHQGVESLIANLQKRIQILEQDQKHVEAMHRIAIKEHENETIRLFKENELLHHQLRETKDKLRRNEEEVQQIKHVINHHRKRAESVENSNSRLEARNKQIEQDLLMARENVSLLLSEKEEILDRSMDLEQQSSAKTREIVQLIEENLRDQNQSFDYASHLEIKLKSYESRVEDLEQEVSMAHQRERNYIYELKQKDLFIQKQQEEFDVFTQDIQRMRETIAELKELKELKELRR